jgi:hypothetical protein
MSADATGQDEEPKPVLWIGLTETGRTHPNDVTLERIGDRVQEAVGEDYHVVPADDRVRLADEEDLEDLRCELARLRRQLRDSDDDG